LRIGALKGLDSSTSLLDYKKYLKYLD